FVFTTAVGRVVIAGSVVAGFDNEGSELIALVKLAIGDVKGSWVRAAYAGSQQGAARFSDLNVVETVRQSGGAFVCWSTIDIDIGLAVKNIEVGAVAARDGSENRAGYWRHVTRGR